MIKNNLPTVSAEFIKNNKNSLLKDYAASLYKRKLPANIDINSNLVRAFNQEFYQRGFSFKLDTKKNFNKDQILKPSLNSYVFKNMCLQTSHHQCLTNGPGFSAIDYVSTYGLTAGENYLVATFSALPFSNNAFSGALCFEKLKLPEIFNPDHPEFSKINKSLDTSLKQGASEKKVFFIPTSKKEQLIFGSEIFDKTKYMFDVLNKNLQNKLPCPHVYKDFTNWALDFCQTIQQKSLPKKNIYYFDINRVIKDYLIFELAKDSQKNLILKGILDIKVADLMIQQYENLVLFLKQNKKTGKITRITWSAAKKTWANNPNKLLEDLSTGELCPSLFLVFSVLMFENLFRCFGSFLQFDYISKLFKVYMQLHKIVGQRDINLKHLKDINFFCAARFPRSQKIKYAFDMFVIGEEFKNNVPKNLKMEYFWQEWL